MLMRLSLMLFVLLFIAFCVVFLAITKGALALGGKGIYAVVARDAVLELVALCVLRA